MGLGGVQGRKRVIPCAFAVVGILSVRAAVNTEPGLLCKMDQGHREHALPLSSGSLHFPLQDLLAFLEVNRERGPSCHFYPPWSWTQTPVWSNTATLSVFFNGGMKRIPGNTSLHSILSCFRQFSMSEANLFLLLLWYTFSGSDGSLKQHIFFSRAYFF